MEPYLNNSRAPFAVENTTRVLLEVAQRKYVLYTFQNFQKCMN